MILKIKNLYNIFMEKILFLDFDGVLNSYEEGSYMTNSHETYGPSKTICEKVKKFCEKNNVKIIISSNWRRFELDGWYRFTHGKVQNPLPKVYEILGDYIIGTLPPIRYVTKAEALILWIEENDFKSDKWIIIDDDPRENLGNTHDYGIKDHYVQTNPEFGITDEIIEKLEKILI